MISVDFGDFGQSSISDMLRRLDWRSLGQRRADSRLTALYKTRKHLVAIDEDQYLQRCSGRQELQYRQLTADKDYTIGYKRVR